MDEPVKINATLQLTSDGDLILRDADGSLSWSSPHFFFYFTHKIDKSRSMVPGQKLVAGMKLTESVSKTNWTQAGLFSLFVSNESLSAYFESDPPHDYYKKSVSGLKQNKEPGYVKFLNGSLTLYIHSAEPTDTIPIPQASSAQYMKLESDDHLRVYEWESRWKQVADLLAGYLGDCGYPLACGKYCICSSGQCSCAGSSNAGMNYFRHIQEKQPNLGCSQVTPLNCSASQDHNFLELKDVTYFTFNSSIDNIDMENSEMLLNHLFVGGFVDEFEICEKISVRNVNSSLSLLPEVE